MQFRVLGKVNAEIDGRSLELNRRRERCLLGLLLLEPGRVIGVDRLVELLWEEPPAHARRTVHSHVARIRAALAAAGADNGILVTDGAGYALQVPPNTVDAHRFQALVDQAMSTSDPATRAEMLHTALSLWRGPVLGDDSDLVRLERVGVELTAKRGAAVEQWLAALIAAGRPQEALPQLARLAKEHPEQERLTVLQMTALYRLGRKADALSAYESTRAWLAENLGIDPTPELRQAHQDVLRDDPALSAAGRPVSQRFLPHDVPDFVGRTQDLAWLESSRSAASTLVITAVAGAGGIGKTALALRWAHQAAEFFPDGQLYVNLRGYDSRRPLSTLDALAYLLRCLGIRREELPSEVDDASALYRSLLSDRRVLIVLDNARSADQVRPMLPGHGACQVLITSRDRLSSLIAHDGARRLSLGVLPQDQGLALLKRLLGDERVDAEPQAAAKVVALCAGLPLALRIAAAKLADRPRMSLADFAKSLADGKRLAALTITGDEDRAVEAVLDQSYESLPPGPQRTFRLLGTIPGPDFTIESVEALTADSPAETVSAVDSLAAAHLIQEGQHGRFGFHDLIREYAVARSAGEDAAALHRYLEYLRDMAVYANSFIISSGQTPPPGLSPHLSSASDAMAWLEAERANLATAVPVAVANGLPELARQIIGPMAGNYLAAGHVTDMICTMESIASELEHLGETAVKFLALHSLGTAYGRVGRTEDAIRSLKLAIAGRTALGDQENAAGSQHNLAAVLLSRGEHEEALQLEESALDSARTIGSERLEYMIIGSVLPSLYQKLGRWVDALDCLTQALAMARKTGTSFAVVQNLNNLGWLYLRAGELELAAHHLAEGLELSQQVGDRLSEAHLLSGLAAIQTGLGNHQEAIKLVHNAHATMLTAGPLFVAEVLNDMGDVYTAAAMPAEAQEHYTKAASLAKQRNLRFEEGRAVAGIGKLLNSRQHLAEALGLLDPIAPVDAAKIRLMLSQMQ